MTELPESVKTEIAGRAKNWGAPTVARRHMEEVAALAWDAAIQRAMYVCALTATAKINTLQAAKKTSLQVDLLKEVQVEIQKLYGNGDEPQSPSFRETK